MPWLWNSSATVALDNLRALFHQPADYQILQIAGAVFRLAITGLFLWLIVRSRPKVPAGPPRRHFDFCMALMFGLIVMPVVWDHYLAMLFIPLAYLLAMTRALRREAVLLLALILLAAIPQHVSIAMWLYSKAPLHSAPALIAAGLFKGAPLLLTALFLLLYHKDLAATYAAPEWAAALER